MSTDFYVYSNSLIAHTTARSADVVTELQAIETGLALLPSEAELKRGTITYAVDSGAANAYVIDLPYVPSGYVDGLEVNFRALNANTGSSTANVNSLGAVSILQQDGSALDANDILVGGMICTRYSSVASALIMTSQRDGSAASAAASAAAAAASASAAATSETNAATSETNAAASASAASTSETNAATSETNADADATATAADAVSTAADAVSTAADASSTAADAIATAADAISTAADASSTAADVTSSAASASAASTSETNAATSETNAATSETNAAASAIAAAAAAASNLYSTVTTLTTGTTNVEISNDGTYYLCDASGGNITINLPAIGTDEGTRYGFQKVGASNTVTFVRDGTDTINGGTSYTISEDTEVVMFVADDNSPDNWVATIQSQTVAGTGLSKTGSSIALAGGVSIDSDGNLSLMGSTVIEKTAAYTLTASENGKIVEVNNASAITITLPQTSTESIPAGFQCTIVQTGAGAVTIAYEGTDTINGASTNIVVSAQWDGVLIYKKTAASPNTYRAVGAFA